MSGVMRTSWHLGSRGVLGTAVVCAICTLAHGLPEPASAEAQSSQYDDPCVSVITGAFVARDVLTRMFVSYCPGNRYLQFENGPRLSMEETDFMGESYKCVDNETGLDHFVLHTSCNGSGCVPNYSVSVVKAADKTIERVFSTQFMDYEGLGQQLVTMNGECLWRGLASAKARLDAALAPLLIGRRQGTSPWDLEPRETVLLAARQLPTEAVVNALGAIRLYSDGVMLPVYVDVREAEEVPDEPRSGSPGGCDPQLRSMNRATFRVLQVRRHSYCGGGGTLLVEDMRSRTWKAIHDYGAVDCARGGGGEHQGGMDYLFVKDDKVYGRGEGGAVDGGAWIEIDLRSLATRKLDAVPPFVAEVVADDYEE